MPSNKKVDNSKYKILWSFTLNGLMISPISETVEPKRLKSEFCEGLLSVSECNFRPFPRREISNSGIHCH